MSKREKFLAMASRPLRTVDVEVAGEVFTLREISEADASEMEVKMQTKEGGWDYARHRMLMVSYSLIDENGQRIVEDWTQLKDAPRSLIGPLYEACLTLSKYDESEISNLAKKSERADA